VVGCCVFCLHHLGSNPNFLSFAPSFLIITFTLYQVDLLFSIIQMNLYVFNKNNLILNYMYVKYYF
jgi:hypothetical protein